MQAPADPVIGQKWFDVSVQPIGQWKIWNGTAWVSAEWEHINNLGSQLVQS